MFKTYISNELIKLKKYWIFYALLAAIIAFFWILSVATQKTVSVDYQSWVMYNSYQNINVYILIRLNKICAISVIFFNVFVIYILVDIDKINWEYFVYTALDSYRIMVAKLVVIFSTSVLLIFFLVITLLSLVSDSPPYLIFLQNIPNFIASYLLEVTIQIYVLFCGCIYYRKKSFAYWVYALLLIVITNLLGNKIGNTFEKKLMGVHWELGLLIAKSVFVCFCFFTFKNFTKKLYA